VWFFRSLIILIGVVAFLWVGMNNADQRVDFKFFHKDFLGLNLNLLLLLVFAVGMVFSFAIWDSERQDLFCARDRLGIKPFYYAVHKDTFCFSSEIRGLLAAGVRRDVNLPVLYDFLARDFYEHSDETFFVEE